MNKDDLQALDLSKHFFHFTYVLAKMFVAIAFKYNCCFFNSNRIGHCAWIKSHEKESDNVINVLSKTLLSLNPFIRIMLQRQKRAKGRRGAMGFRNWNVCLVVSCCSRPATLPNKPSLKSNLILRRRGLHFKWLICLYP